MSDRILDLTTEEGRLHVVTDNVVLERTGERLFAIPARDLAVALVSSRGLTMTPGVLVTLAEHGAAVVLCDRVYRPKAQLLPLEAHHLQTERLRLQVEASKPRKKQLWKQIVQAKIRAQAKALEIRGISGARLQEMAKRVRSGDPENVEAQASRWYWPRIFGDPAFRRRRDGAGPNALLNYGYAVLRGAVARAVCASGLHPSLGIHHANRYDPFSLVDDLMEPMRPMVDLAVAARPGDLQCSGELTPGAKRQLVESLTAPRLVGTEKRTLFDAAARLASSLVKGLAGETTKMIFPEITP